jgi:hypothetical protein
MTLLLRRIERMQNQCLLHTRKNQVDALMLIAARKYKLLGSDYMLNVLIAASPTIQSFWLDPPIVYQGNYINDLDGIPSFTRTTY